MIQLFERLNDMSCINSRFIEKGNLEIMLFTLQSKMRANNQRAYLPAEGKLISDINKAWDRLEKAEHERELSLREELIRYRISTEKFCLVYYFHAVLMVSGKIYAGGYVCISMHCYAQAKVLWK